MNRLNRFLTGKVSQYVALSGKNETPEQVANVVAGLSHYINEYLAEQIPEQLENETEASE